MTERVFRLKGTCNNYPWGKKGSESLASQLQRKNNKDFQPKEDEFYSELWFGDYPDFPARVLETGELLKEVTDRNKEGLLGRAALEKFDGNLPFLPKILSISKALPLQIHPSKPLAAKLHAQDPENFEDPNHKPEIAIALSRFETFAGFKPLPEIAPLFRLPSLRQFAKNLPDAAAWSDKELREAVRNLLKADGKTIRDVQNALISASRDALGKAAYIHDLMPRLQQQYGPEDPGSLVALICMNFLVLSPGEAIFIPADGIHAYLSGDIVECMARSDNVLNSGFCTDEERNDADMFTNALTFVAHSAKDIMLPSQKSEKSKSGKTVVFKPPIPEFELLKTDLQAGERDQISASDGPGVFIVTRGEGRLVADGREFEVSEGSIFFVAAGVPIQWSTETGLQVHLAVA
ncbi:mannose-6-phosphate isomerase [Podospora aff. communis PSN243]|uniref:Mannose-6-phosphate isomerase n=1 Tax=Podospora aff. communis PSN243 TaxID=3040156 RepID=A0AAV9H7Z9_9PEZI|nr:mannose-6-phosphate isomerase [Podospora aff. communis PSN243]